MSIVNKHYSVPFSSILVFMGLFLLATFVSNQGKAASLTSSETLVDYARVTISRALDEQYLLVPGTLEIEPEAGIDLGNAVRALIRLEKKTYNVEFRAVDLNGQLYSGAIQMVVSAISRADTQTSDDNNTTLREIDRGTGRMIKVQLRSFGVPASTELTPKHLSLRLLK